MTTTTLLFIQLGLFGMILLLIECAYRLSSHSTLAASSSASIASITTFVQALMGLILAFAISDAALRLDRQRNLVLDEAKAAYLVWQRIDLLPVDSQAQMRAALRSYLDERIRAKATLPFRAGYERHAAHARQLHRALWSLAVESTKVDPEPRNLLLPSIGLLAETGETQSLAVRTHVSTLAMVFVVTLLVIGALLVGVEPGGGPRNWPHRLAYAIIVSLAIAVILDLEYPYAGIAGTRSADVVLFDVRSLMD